MRNIVFVLLIVLSSNPVISQSKLNEKIDKGIELFENGEEDEALKVWQKVERKARKRSSTFGTVIGNIMYYYIQEDDEKNALKYYDKIINSKLNDRDENHEIGKPFKNYRYHATMHLASYYGKSGKFEKGLNFVEKADNIAYETTSLTAYMYQKVDLAFWKYRFLKDLNQIDKAISKLIERAFEYDYKGMYPMWATVSPSNDENELAKTICSHFDELVKLKKDIDIAIENITFNTSKNQIEFTLHGIFYEINLYSKLESKAACQTYLRNSFFYNYLADKTKK